MKLAEALKERADLNVKIKQLENRLSNNLFVQEGEESAEDPALLKKQLDEAIDRLVYLITCINLTNAQVKVDGKTLTEMIAEKDALTIKISAYRSCVRYASTTADRVRGTEIKVKTTIKVTDWQKEVDQMAKKLRLLDNVLQANNWTVDLIE